MPRIVGIDVPADKRVEVALTYIYGIGLHTSRRILQSSGINPDMRSKDLSPEEVARIASIIQSDFRVEGDLKREVSGNIKRLISIHSYRGLRHRMGLPVRGQRTSTNARTRKGPRKAAVAIRKKI